jgi:glycosyltransferase involved in cell wall biosynthesis
VRAHGILSGRPEYPDFSKRGNPDHQILAFGKWGTYKRLELLVAAFEKIAKTIPNVKLVIAGGNHPKTPGYVESIASYCRGDSRIQFTGYVAEEAIPDLFQSTSITVMPYTSSAGSSGVAHLACEYGVPILASNIADFREVASEEGIAMEFFECGNVDSLAQKFIELLQSPERLKAMAEHNFSAALRMSMPEIIRQYIRSFDLHHRVKVLRAASRFRRMPRWMPLRPAISRRIGQKLLTWHDAEIAAYLESAAAKGSNGNGNGSHTGPIPVESNEGDDSIAADHIVNIDRSVADRRIGKRGGDAA